MLGAILVLAGAIYSYAYDGNNPLVMGHSGNEIHVDFNGETKLLNGALVELSEGTENDGSVSIDYNDRSQIEFTTGDNDDWLAHTCPTDMVLVGGAGCGGSYCGGLRYA